MFCVELKTLYVSVSDIYKNKKALKALSSEKHHGKDEFSELHFIFTLYLLYVYDLFLSKSSCRLCFFNCFCVMYCNDAVLLIKFVKKIF